MMRILQMKKQNKTKKAQQNHPKLREITVCTQQQSGDDIPEPTLPITCHTGESQYRRDKGERRGAGRHPRYGQGRGWQQH